MFRRSHSSSWGFTFCQWRPWKRNEVAGRIGGSAIAASITFEGVDACSAALNTAVGAAGLVNGATERGKTSSTRTGSSSTVATGGFA